MWPQSLTNNQDSRNYVFDIKIVNDNLNLHYMHSEHRSEAEQAHPDSNPAELDSLLSTRWSLVPDNAKMKFFLRARDAISDEDRCVKPNNCKGRVL